MKMEIRSFKPNWVVSGLHKEKSCDGEGEYYFAHAYTPQGSVHIYAQHGAKSYHHTSLDLFHKGRLYSTSFDRYYTPRGVASIAKKFSAQVAKEAK